MSELEKRIEEIGRDLLTTKNSERRWWHRFISQDAILDRIMAEEKTRVAALRFVDVLPSLKRDSDLTRHLDDYFHDLDLPIPFPGLAHWTMHAARNEVASHLVAPIVRGLAGRMAKRFIAGDRVSTAKHALNRLHDNEMGFTLDLLGEAVICEAEAKTYQARYLELIRDLSPIVASWSGNRMDTVSGRHCPRLNLSIKITALYSQFDAIAPEETARRVKDRLRPLLQEAKANRSFVTLDMEDYDTKDTTIEIFKEIISEEEFVNWPDVGIAIQAYLRDAPEDLKGLVSFARERRTPFTVRLVRGAYWDAETVIAHQHGWPVPVWTHKTETDACYEFCLRLLMENYPHIELAAGTHNVRSLAMTMALAQEIGLRPDQYELQMLYGMADPLKQRLVEANQRLRVYVPFGKLIPGMAYLVRRLLENSGSQSFGALGMKDDAPVEDLLRKPSVPESLSSSWMEEVKDEDEEFYDDATVLPEREETSPGETAFENEPVRRYTDESERLAMRSAIGYVSTRLGRRYPILIDGEPHSTEELIRSVNPANPEQVIGLASSATSVHVERTVEAATMALASWRDTSAQDRVAVIRQAAKMMRAKREEFAAWLILEAGKPWREADADVVEAIDFLEYYASEALRLDKGIALHVAGQTNHYVYEPRGVGAVIGPWNFPLAILTGMAAAPLVTGNTVVIKPPPQTPIIAAQLTTLLHDAGVPKGVLNYLPGGDEAGDALVKDGRVAFVNFTGSQAVGCLINRNAAEFADGQDHLKHIIAEMGGKNAIVVDMDADLDDAVLGVAHSAFGYAGQKCSACSRVIVVGDLYNAFLERLVETTRSLRIGPPSDPATFLGPVIDREAYDRICSTIEQSKSEHRLIFQENSARPNDGFYVPPAIFAEVDPASRLAQEEIFGPVLAVMRAKNFDEAIEIAMNSRYALTGGVYSRSPAHLDQAKKEYRVGNLYLNQKITGAIVNRQPFGGMKMSGTNAKAGGPDYLMQFVHPRTVTENTLRRGFAPGEGSID